MAATAAEATAAEDRANARLHVNLGAVVANWQLLRDRVAPAACAAVVKANAYGLGANRVVPALVAAGCRHFFTAELEEALHLVPHLAVGTGVSVAVLGGLLPGTEATYAAHGIVPVLNHLDEIARWQSFARHFGHRLEAWIHVDTGMNRLGLGPDEQTVLADGWQSLLDGINLRGWISHLACADEANHPHNPSQLTRFSNLLARLPIATASFANSSGIFLGRPYHFDLVRPGAALYGINPTPGNTNPMHPVIRLDARILQVRSVDTSMTVGYGAGHRVMRRGRVATLGLGYADGYLRSLSNKGVVYIGGCAAPVIGRVSMDLITVDVTDIPDRLVLPGGWAEVMGPRRTVDEVAAEAGTIGYEVLTRLGSRFLRVYA